MTGEQAKTPETSEQRPLPVEPGHVMSREQYARLLQELRQK